MAITYHVVAHYEAEEDDNILHSATTGRSLSRSQQWDNNIAAEVADSTATFDKQVLAFNINPLPRKSFRSPVSAVFAPAEYVSECMDDNEPEIHASTVSIKPSNNSVDEGNMSEYTKIETDGNTEEFKPNTDKKRKRSSDSGGGCKRCHCKKSKCLKLYCDCFAAGLYCAGSCACQGCYNKPEYENMILESRQQIESWNPLAFAPIIVEHIVEPPASSYEENESSFTPTLARHKRGCSCKKSMCLKKFYECYHSNVGCSDGCRCQGCQNVYGQKIVQYYIK